MQDISTLEITKITVLSEQRKFFLLDLKKIPNCNSKKIELTLIVNQASVTDLRIIGIGELSKVLDIKIDLMGADAYVNVSGAFFLNKKSSVQIHIWQNHLTPHAQSKVEIKTVLTDEACFNYCGTIFISEHARGSIAGQVNKNIVLSNAVNVRSTPNIEVLNEDVQCSHGSAIGGVDQEQLWYLMNRGLTRSEALKLLLKSFLGIDLDFNYIETK